MKLSLATTFKTTTTRARLWREMYRKWALAFQFFLKSLGRSARSQYSVFDVSQWIFRFLLVIMYVLYSFAILSEHRLLRVFWMYFIYLVCKVYQRNQLLEKWNAHLLPISRHSLTIAVSALATGLASPLVFPRGRHILSLGASLARSSSLLLGVVLKLVFTH